MSNVTCDSIEVEERILAVAYDVFLKYGVNEATMKQIAEAAGISRTSLNYYFRSKSHLIQRFFINIENKIIPTIFNITEDDSLSVLDKINIFIDEYIGLITKYPMIPSFMFSEITRNPGWVIKFFRDKGISFNKFSRQIEYEIAEGKINSFKFEDLIANILGLCVLPTLGKPLLMEFFFDWNEKSFSQFMASRKEIIKIVINNWLKPS